MEWKGSLGKRTWTERCERKESYGEKLLRLSREAQREEQRALLRIPFHPSSDEEEEEQAEAQIVSVSSTNTNTQEAAIIEEEDADVYDQTTILLDSPESPPRTTPSSTSKMKRIHSERSLYCWEREHPCGAYLCSYCIIGFPFSRRWDLPNH